MCHVCTGEAYDRPISKEDVAVVKKHYSEIDSSIIDDLYTAITDYHTPQPAVLVALAEIFTRAIKKDYGMYDWAVIPFSALDLDTWKRVQTPQMLAFHSVFESMALAQRNVILLNNVFKKHGLQFVMFCDCGCSAMPSDLDVFNTQAYKEINAVRSEMEALGTEVIVAPSFEAPEWVNKKLDMGKSEVDSYKRMWAVLCDLSGIERGSFRAQAVQGMNFLQELAKA